MTAQFKSSYVNNRAQFIAAFGEFPLLSISDAGNGSDAVGQIINALSILDTGFGSDKSAASTPGKVKITFDIKKPVITFFMKKIGVDFTIN